MPKVTIAQLENRIQELKKENVDLKLDNQYHLDKSRQFREEFTKVIGNVEAQISGGVYSDNPLLGYRKERTKETMSWPEIFFAIGELNADANIHCMKATICRLHTEIQDLKCQLEMKKAPAC